MSKLCYDCALRLYNSKSYNLPGIGNPFYGNVIVIPSVDYKAYKNKSMDFSSQVEVIKDILIPSTGVEESNFFITAHIKCYKKGHLLCDDTIRRCSTLLAYEINMFDFKNILLLGDAAKYLLKIDIKDNFNNVFLDAFGRRYFVNYSPFVKNINEKLFDIFKEYLQKWYNSINSGMYDYNIVML